MRSTAGDVVRHPSRLADWWVDLPARRDWWWRAVLFERGQGWLRWGTDRRESWAWEPSAMARYCEGEYAVAPPLRRLASYLRSWLIVPRLMLIGFSETDYDQRGVPVGSHRYRFSREEAQPLWPRDLIDVDRKRLWH